MSKGLNLTILLILAYVFYCIHDSAVNAPGSVELSRDASRMATLYDYSSLVEPEQKKIEPDGIRIVMEKDYYKVTLSPAAEYRISAMVMGKKKYTWGWDSDVAPYDLVLAWNKLMLPENQKGIVYSQGSRWYYFHYDESFPLTESYIYKHSANHHIIPANTNILEAIKKIRNKERIYLEGYLVNIKGQSEQKGVWWNTSLSRNDRGNGSCEVLYVNRAIIGKDVYE